MSDGDRYGNLEGSPLGNYIFTGSVTVGGSSYSSSSDGFSGGNGDRKLEGY